VKLHWKGFGRKVYGVDLVLEWNSHISGETVYSLFHYSTHRVLLFLRVPDYSWQGIDPEFFTPESLEDA
jgi:hypothetical protein